MSVVLYIAVDLTVGSVYCFLCKKFVYDTDVESVARAKADEAWRRTGEIMLVSLWLVDLFVVRVVNV